MNQFSKKIVKAHIAFLLCVAPALAAEHDSFFGEWGTKEQCQRGLIIPTGTKHATPFDIQPDWMNYGDVWCRLIWTSTAPTTGDTLATANALCGEDAVRDYQLKFEVSGDSLTIVWNLFHKNGPLMRCPAP